MTKKVSFKNFKSRTLADNPTTVIYSLGGDELEMQVIGAHSRSAMAELDQIIASGKKDDPTLIDLTKQTARIAASRVTHWSADEPCTPENVYEFLEENPDAVGAVNNASNDKKLFTRSFANS